MIILGIDPGLRNTGYGLIERQGSQLKYITSGKIVNNTSVSLADALGTIYQGVEEIIKTYQPATSSVEIIFVNNNAKTSLILGHARGAAICALSCSKIPIAEYTALQIKKSIVGHGRATKPQVQDMVTRLLHLDGTPSTDAADALAAAICHAHMFNYHKTILSINRSK